MARRLAGRSIDPGYAVILVTVGAVGIVVAAVPELRWFLALALGCGAILAGGLLAWRRRHPVAALSRPDETLGPVQINIASVPIGTGIASLLVAGGSVAILLIGLEEARWFSAAALGCGVLLALVLVGWRSAHPRPQNPEHTLGPHSDIRP
jgi:hypothetical protein